MAPKKITTDQIQMPFLFFDIAEKISVWLVGCWFVAFYSLWIQRARSAQVWSQFGTLCGLFEHIFSSWTIKHSRNSISRARHAASSQVSSSSSYAPFFTKLLKSSLILYLIVVFLLSHELHEILYCHTNSLWCSTPIFAFLLLFEFEIHLDFFNLLLWTLPLLSFTIEYSL